MITRHDVDEEMTLSTIELMMNMEKKFKQFRKFQ